MNLMSSSAMLIIANLLLGYGLMSDAMIASLSLRNLRILKMTIHNTIESNSFMCTDGKPPILQLNNNNPSFINLAKSRRPASICLFVQGLATVRHSIFILLFSVSILDLKLVY